MHARQTGPLGPDLDADMPGRPEQRREHDGGPATEDELPSGLEPPPVEDLLERAVEEEDHGDGDDQRDQIDGECVVLDPWSLALGRPL